jgi:hypothetical protein
MNPSGKTRILSGYAWLSLGIFAVCSSFLISSGWTEITTLSGWDPDDQLRLVQLRDLLNGQSWFDTTQYRMNIPDGAPMHWSRLIELPLAAIILVLRPFFGQTIAEMIAGTTVPLLLLGAITFIVSRIATAIASRAAGFAAALMVLSSGALLIQTRPMRIDHHGWQIAMAVLALWTIFWVEARKAGIVLGIALAVWLHISLEGAPMTAAFFLLLGIRWVRNASEALRLFWTISSFAGVSLLLFFGTQAQGIAAAIYCDTVSPPHIVVILVATTVMLASIRFLPDDWRMRLAAVGLAGFSAGTILYLQAPTCLDGAFGDMDPLVREYWYSKVNEGLPVWQQPWRTALALSSGLLWGAASWLVLRAKLENVDRRKLDTIGFFLFYGLLLSILVIRTISVATAFAIPATAALVALLFDRYRQCTVSARRIMLVAMMLALMVPGAVISTLLRAFPDAAEKAEAKVTISNNSCESALSVRTLSALPTGNIIAPFDMGPMILSQTQHSVIASSHHRNKKGMHDHIQIFRSAPDISRALMKARDIDYLAICPKEAELEFYAKKDPGGLWGQIARRNVPDWLEPLPDMGKGIKVWRIR